MNLTQLKYFISVAELENTLKASEFLHASQSAVSKNISKLEQELGCSLFNRNGKNITLNAAGKRFLECANQVVMLLDEAKEDLSIMDEKTNRKIRIGMATDCRGLGKCIKEFEKDCTEAEFDISGAFYSKEKLDINDYDAIIYPDVPEYSKYSGYTLYNEKCYAAVNVRNPLSKELVFNIRNLSDQRVIFMRDRGNFEHTHRLLDALSIDHAHFCYTDMREIHKQVIADDVAIGFVPEGAADFYHDERIKLIPILDKRFERKIKISFRKDKYLSEMALAFKSFVISFYKIEVTC